MNLNPKSTMQNQAAIARSNARPFSYSLVGGLGISLLVMGLQGCSMFMPKSDNGSNDPSFHATASSDTLPLVLPVEIAGDIQKIAQGQQPTNGWSPTPLDEQETKEETEDAANGAKTGRLKRARRDIASTAPTPMNFQLDGANRSYKVKRGDTLMKIAFEAYGNLYRWREIFDANKTKIVDFNAVPVGTVLTIGGNEYVKIERNGLPYLIRRHDTLTSISYDIYGHASYWKALWNNNKMMIHDPNKIYSGFTLYYEEKPSLRGLASLKAKKTASATKQNSSVATGADLPAKTATVESPKPNRETASEKTVPQVPGVKMDLPEEPANPVAAPPPSMNTWTKTQPAEK